MFPPGNEPTFDDYDEIFHPDFAWKPRTGDAVSGRTYEGRRGLERYVVDLRESFESFVPHSTTYEVEGDLVLACSQLTVRSQSGIELTNEGSVLWEVRDGRVASGEAFFSHAAGRAELEARVRA
jgi:ketosteroid isomerase-like protein